MLLGDIILTKWLSVESDSTSAISLWGTSRFEPQFPAPAFLGDLGQVDVK